MLSLTNRHEFTSMLQTLVDVTSVQHKHVDITEPVCFVGFASQYRMGSRLLAEELHTINGSIYYIDQNWYEDHVELHPEKPNVVHLGCDFRNFDFTMIVNDSYPQSDRLRILAGCRNFSLEQAKLHWADNPEVYSRILMAEQIAIHRGWLPKPELSELESRIHQLLTDMNDTELLEYAQKQGYIKGFKLEPVVDAGELACEKTPTIVMPPDEDEEESDEDLPTPEETRYRKRIDHECANPER